MDFMENILTDSDSAAGIPGGFAHEFSLELNGSEQLRKNADVAVNIGNVWTTLTWVKPLSGHGGGNLINIKPVTGSTNSLLIGFASDGRVDLTIVDTVGSSFKIYQYDALVVSDIWNQLIGTWDGTNFKLHHNGTFVSPSTILLDNAVTMTNTNRRVGLGGTADGTSPILGGRVHSSALWSINLSDPQINSSYNGGDGSTADLSTIQGVNLEHWWVCGDTALCEDLIPTNAINLLDDASNISIADSVADAP